MAAFNCCDYIQVTHQRLKEYYDLDIEEAGICYTCKATNLQLFAPDSVYKDFAVNNCVRTNQPAASQETIKVGSIDYSWIVDIYAPEGVFFYETRDSAMKYVDISSDLYK